MKRELQYRVRAYAFAVWIKNLFVPMYGQYDWTGRIISFFMRVFVMIGRAIALCLEAIIYGIIIILWAVFPIVALMMFVLSFVRGAFFVQVRGIY